MRYEVFSGAARGQRADALVIGCFDKLNADSEAASVDRLLKGRIARLLAAGDFAGRAGETLLLTDMSGIGSPRLLLVGLGSREAFNRRAWRKAHSVAIAALLRTRVASAVLAIDKPVAERIDAEHRARAVAELTGAGLYRVNDAKTGKRPRPAALNRVKIGPFERSELVAARRGAADGTQLAASAALLRDLGNLPGNVCTPRYLGRQALELGRTHRSLKVRVLDEPAIRKLKMGSFLSVAQGSAEPPRFIIMEHRMGRAGAAPVVLVGKGITFDTGGISLKDPGAMDEMKYDMCGAATVIAALDLAARLKLPINLVGLVATCENMPGPNAVKPGDIVRSADGQTIEVLNTDAEGRLILCDALNYARRFDPAAVVDMATLTGACVIALGNHHTGVMGNDQALAEELVKAGREADDRAWQLPLTEEYGEQLRSNFADMANIGGREAGAITAGAFLGKFTRGLTWAHMDIAGTAWLSGAAKGATGRPLPLIAEFLIRRARG
ncbi:MAG: leucyl aminopeptidase [Steroidobacteraceae bacterium]